MAEKEEKAKKEGAGDAPEMSKSDMEQVKHLQEGYEVIKKELSNNIVGMQDVVEQLLIAIFCRGHCLLVGVPGLAKTLLIKSLAMCLDLEFNRIQFTPDLMP